MAGVTKVWHNRNKRVDHNGHVWHLDVAAWRDAAGGVGVLRVYKVHGDITSPDLSEAIGLIAAEEGLTWTMELGNG